MRYVVCAALALVCTPLLGQTPATRSPFEVASVRAAAKDGRATRGFPKYCMKSAAATGDPARF